MGMGVVASQLLNLLYIPLFSRIFAQDAYAIQGNFLSILNIVFVVASMGLTSAMAVPKKQIEVDKILRVVLWCALCISLFILIGLLLSDMLNLDLSLFIFKVDGYLISFLFPIAIFSRTVMFVYETRISLLGNFKLLSFTKILSSLAYGISTYIAYNLSKTNDLSLIIGNTISYGIIALLLFKFYKVDFLRLKLREIKSVFERYQRFIYFSMPNMLMNAISSALPIILLLEFYGKDIAGEYSMAIKIVAIPVSFIVASLRSVYINKLAKTFQNSRDRFYNVTKKIMAYSHTGSAFIFFFLFVLSPYIIPVFLGDNWSATYKYVQLLCPWYFMLIGNSPLSVIFDIIEKQKENFFREIFLLLFRVLAIILSYIFGLDGFSCIVNFVIVSVIFNIFLSWMILFYSKKVTTINVNLE